MNISKRQKKRAYKLMRFVQKWRIRFYRLVSTNRPKELSPCTYSQPVQFAGDGCICLDKVTFGVFPSARFLDSYSYLEARGDSDCITIGAGTIFNNNAQLIADKSSISIGRDCLIGLNFTALSSDFHGLAANQRRSGQHLAKDIVISDNVFIGNDVTVLKGVNIGDNAVIANGSLVTKDVAANAIVAGVPAKYLGDIPND